MGCEASKRTVSPSERVECLRKRSLLGASVILQNQERSGLPNHIYPCGHLKYSVYLFPFLECFPQKSFLSVLMATKGEHNG